MEESDDPGKLTSKGGEGATATPKRCCAWRSASVRGKPTFGPLVQRIGGTPPSDMSLFIRSFSAWHALGRRMASIAPCLMRPASSGSIKLGGNLIACQ